MIDFEPSEEQALMVTSVTQLAAKLRARARDTERDHRVPDDLVTAAREMGLATALAVAEDAGGAGLGLVTAVLLDEAIANGDAGAAFALGGPGALATAVSELGSPAQSKAVLERLASSGGSGAVAWSEPRPNKARAGLTTRAVREGSEWVLTGEKAFVFGAASAELLVVFAQIDEELGYRGLGAFVVERAAKGVTVGPRLATLGLDAASAHAVSLDAVRVNDEARLERGGDLDAQLRFFVKEGLRVAARAVGLTQSAADVALEYASTRKAFGKPIGHFQAIAFTLADRAMDADAARALVLRAAWLWEAARTKPKLERDALKESAWAISWAAEAAMRAGDDAVQLHGGSGFIRDYPVEKMMRDAKTIGLCMMTAEHADQLAAAIELGRALDPALVLPTPETQSVFT
ncbi:MAG: acyl-CoA dehydrogenase family protein [Polyangiaceae bacterium]